MHACINIAPDMLQPSLKLPGWFRRLVLAALALSVCTTCSVRVLTAATALRPLQARNIRQPRWTVAGLPLWTRKTRVAVLHQGDASSDGARRFHPTVSAFPLSAKRDADTHHHNSIEPQTDAFIAIAYHLAHEPDVELTLFHGPFAHGNEETISRFWKGGYRKVEDYADPFAGQGGSGLVCARRASSGRRRGSRD